MLFIFATDKLLKTLLSLNLIYSDVWRCYGRKEGHYYFNFAVEKAEESRSIVTCPSSWESCWGIHGEKILLLSLQLTLFLQQLDFAGTEWLLSSAFTTKHKKKNPKHHSSWFDSAAFPPFFVSVISIYFFLHMNIGEENWYRGIHIFMQE